MTVIQDLKFAVRLLLRRRAATLVAILTLGLGIAANTAMFSLLEATLFKPPMAEDPGRLVWVAGARPGSSRYQTLSYPDYRDIRARASAFSGVLAYTPTWLAIGGPTPIRVPGQVVSGNYFDVLGIRAAQGRTFRPDEDEQPGAHPVVVLSDALWRSRFEANPGILDSTVIVNGHAFTVIGVAPRRFSGVEMNDDAPMGLWIPMAMAAQAMPDDGSFLTSRGANGMRVVGRLKPDASPDQANAMVDAIAKQLSQDVPADSSRRLETRFVVLPLVGGLDPTNRSELAPMFGLLMVLPLLVLIVACANAANVLLSRGLERRKELAMRRALGATRARLVGQLLTESVLMSLLAGGAGVILSLWLTALVTRLGDVPASIDAIITPDGRVLAATAALAMLTGLLFGLAPALVATRQDLTPAIKDDVATLAIGRTRHRLRDVFVIGQIAVSLVLLITAGLYLQSLSKMLRVDPGYDARNGLAVAFDLGLLGYSPARQATFEQRLLDEARTIPGVESAALSSVVPFGGRMLGTSVQTPDAREDERAIFTLMSNISAGYFGTLGVRLLHGRDFTDRDDAAGTPVAIVNETLARRLWGDRDPIGQQFRQAGSDEPLRQVVGVARDGKYDDLTESATAFFYVPQRQQPSRVLTLLVRSSGDPAAIAEPVTRLVKTLDANLPLYRQTTFEGLIGLGADKRQAAASMIGVFGVLALILAALGIYGVTAHGVTLRTKEIGIRMSLGAQTADVLSLFVREDAGRTAIGIAIGLAISAAVSKVLSGFLFGLSATDLATFAGAALALGAVAAAASYLPARRATLVDPIVTLRAE